MNLSFKPFLGLKTHFFYSLWRDSPEASKAAATVMRWNRPTLVSVENITSPSLRPGSGQILCTNHSEQHEEDLISLIADKLCPSFYHICDIALSWSLIKFVSPRLTKGNTNEDEIAEMMNSSCWREGENINHLPVSKSPQKKVAVLA